MAYQTREEWLNAALSIIRDRVPGLASRVRVACGFPSTYTRSGTLSECWPDQASRDGTWEVLISPTVALPTEVFTLLLGSVLHTLPGAASKTSNTYRSACLDAGLAPADESWKTLTGTEYLWETYAQDLEALGVYPHAEIQAGTRKVQQTRMIKLCCPSCGYTIRTTAKWIATGLPVCHDGTEFVAEESAE